MSASLVTSDEHGPSPAEVYRAVDRSILPEIADILDRLAMADPDVLAAVEDVDRTLIWEAMEEPPFQRLVRSGQQARFYARLKRSA